CARATDEGVEVRRGRGIDGERERRWQEKVGEGEAVEKSRNKNPVTVEIGFVFHPLLRRCVFLCVLLCIVRFFFVWMESWKWDKDLHLYHL
uniref:Uncharacterized protein n=1 Tax=Oryza glaberrima TaxID=4538 RepID=I1QQU6_ORYGL